MITNLESVNVESKTGKANMVVQVMQSEILWSWALRTGEDRLCRSWGTFATKHDAIRDAIQMISFVSDNEWELTDNQTENR